jgi:hypothetical protein
MPLLVHEGRTLFFAHVPKTGGSSVTDYLEKRFGPLSMIEAFTAEGRLVSREAAHGDVVIPVDHLTARAIAPFLPRDLAHSFAVVREPVARILSEFRFQSGRSVMSRLGFATWLRVMLAAARIDPRIYENHIRPQGDLVPEGAKVFRLEDGFEPLVAWLDSVTGSRAPGLRIEHLLKSARTPIPLRRQDVEAIRRFYAEDYRRFGYADPDPSGLPDDGWSGLRDALAAILARLLVWKQRRDWLR